MKNEEVTKEAKLKNEERKLTKYEEERIEKNRTKALLLRQSRLAKNQSIASQSCIEQVAKLPPRVQDTGAGFLLEECEDNLLESRPIYVPSAPPVIEDRLHCENCNVEFVDSFLSIKFDLCICDNCREPQGKHKLIPKTEAKKEYLLKDCDLDKREPPLKYVIKQNPHYSRGDMKLYLKCQVEERALLVWDSEENLEAAKEHRFEERDKRKQKAYDKKIKALRMTVRSSLYRQSSTAHEHVYGEETYKEDDMYEKVCQSCGHVLTYEKM